MSAREGGRDGTERECCPVWISGQALLGAGSRPEVTAPVFSLMAPRARLSSV